MLIGLPKEIKNHEYRVGLTPASVRELTTHGHQVLVQKGAGEGIGMGDDKYLAAGAILCEGAPEVFAKAEMIVKVKEPQPQECAMLRPGQILYTYLLLAPDPEQPGGGEEDDPERDQDRCEAVRGAAVGHGGRQSRRASGVKCGKPED